MANPSTLQTWRRRWRELCAANRANVTVIFALATIPVIGFVGAAVDYSHANAVKASLQMALDSTALMLSKSAATLSENDLQTKANDYFKALFARSDATNPTITVAYTTTGGSQVSVKATTSVKTNFMGLMGFSSLPVSASSLIKWGNTKLRVALVLDTTGSMASAGKMTAMQTATKNLLTQLQNAAAVDGDVYVSIIPFSKDVNLDGSNYNASWIYWGTPAQDATLSDNTSWDANNGTCSVSGNSPRSTCLTKGTCSLSGYNSQNSCISAGTCSLSGYNSQSSCTSAGTCSNPGETTQSNCTTQKACSNASYTSKNSCQNHGYTWGFGTWTPGTWTTGVWTAATWTPKNHNTWNGCVVDRGDPSGPNTGNYDTNATAPTTSTPATLYAAEQYSSCSSAAMGLNYNWSTMKTLVDNLSPAGNTNQGLGLQLGWLSLVGGGPFSMPAKNSNFKYTEAIILLTDGLNTQNRWYTSQTSIDNREKITCDNLNAAKITLYTVQVNTDGDPTSLLLKNCAGSPGSYPDAGKFFLLTSANQMVTTFQQIATELSNLRIAK